jgi:hypothetical protein
MSAAMWSAVAASFAALSSFLIYRIQRRNLLESVRPELVLAGWGRREEESGDKRREYVTFNTLCNIGRGAALNVLVFSDFSSKDRTNAQPRSFLMEVPLVVTLAPNESMTLDGNVPMWWDLTSGETTPEHIDFQITLSCSDTRGMRYETRYSLMAWHPRLSARGIRMQEVARGVFCGTRTTTIRAVWFPKMRSRVMKVGSKAKKSWNKLRDQFRRTDGRKDP